MMSIESLANANTIRVVLDANVLISAATLGLQARHVLDLIEDDKLTASTSLDILGEVEQKLREKFRFEPQRIADFLEYVTAYSTTVGPVSVQTKRLRDPLDLHVLGTAVAAEANLIITTDRDLLTLKRFKGIGIVHPKTIGWIFREP